MKRSGFLAASALLVVAAFALILAQRDKDVPPRSRKRQAPASETGAPPSLLPPRPPAATGAPASPDALTPPAGPADPEPAEENPEASPAVEAIAAELQDLAMQEGGAALRRISAYLDHADTNVRILAIEALEQFGDRNAIPELERRLQTATDPGFRNRLVAAIDFLHLPRLRDQLDDDGTLREASGE